MTREGRGTGTGREGRSGHRWIVAASTAAIALAIGGVLALFAVRHTAEARERDVRRAAADAGPVVRTTTAEVARRSRIVTLTGEVRAWRQATLYAKLAGYVRRILVDKGDRVREGQLLATIESPDADQQVAAAEADLLLREQEARRARELAPRSIVSQQELDQAETALRVARTALARARAMQSYAALRAPFDGYVTARFVDAGALLPAATGSTSSAQPVVEIADMDRLRVTAYPGQDEALAVREGDVATISSGDRAPVEAKVVRLSRSLDPRTRTMLVEMVVENVPARMYPGQFVRIDLRIPRPPRPVVPAQALVFRGEAVSVAVVEANRVRVVPIVPGDHDGREVEVLRGLRGGEQVALDASGLADGAPVQPVARPAADAGAGAPNAR